jgi:TPR repeat protein
MSKASMAGDEAEKLYNRASTEADKKNFAKSAEFYERAMLLGYVSAINELALCYDYGRGRKKNKAMAISLYQRGARAGDPCAMHNLAIVYRDEKKFDLAEKWFLRAVVSGEPGSALDLAKLQLSRKTTSSLVLADKYLRTAAQAAQNALFSGAEEEELAELQRVVQQRLVKAV